MPLAFLTALGRWAWGDADPGGSREREELLPLRPLPGTEAPGTEAPQGADTLRLPPPTPRLKIYFGIAQPWVPGAHLQVGGGLGMLLLVLLKLLRQN